MKIGSLHSSTIITRYKDNPILTASMVPYPSELVFNAGVVKYQGKYVMVFRNDYDYVGGTQFNGTNIGLATSSDGINWKVESKPVFSLETEEISRAYDPRLVLIEDELYMCFAVDTKHGIRGGIAKTTDLHHFEILSLTLPDNRNLVLFPEKIGGMYCRLERPFTVYSRGGKDRFDIWMSQSPDLKYWGNAQLVLGVEDVSFANDKIGPAAPPVKTAAGWLMLFHSVDLDSDRGKNGWENCWQKRYCGGIALLDLNDPSKVLGVYQEPLLAPETIYEVQEGFRTNVIFPTSMLLEDSELKIYYGAADTVVALATCQLADVLQLFQ